MFRVEVHLIRGIPKILREASTNNHHLAIPLHSKQDLDIDPLDYNDSIPLRSNFFYPAHLGFCRPWLIPVIQVLFHNFVRQIQYRRYESTYLLFNKARGKRTSIYLNYVCCRRCIRRNTLCRMVLHLSLQ